MAEKDYNVPELTTEELQKRIRKIDTMDLSYGYVQLMEATRVKYGLSIYDWCRVIGITPSVYSGLLAVKPGYARNGTKNLTIIASIFRFCYIFGYDLTGVAKEFATQREELSFSFDEISLWLSKFSDETLLSIADTIHSSNEPKLSRSRSITAIKNYIEARNNISAHSKVNTDSESAENNSRTSDDTVIVNDSEL